MHIVIVEVSAVTITYLELTGKVKLLKYEFKNIDIRASYIASRYQSTFPKKRKTKQHRMKTTE